MGGDKFKNMLLDRKQILKFLDIDSKICLYPEEMAKAIKVTFYPCNKNRLSHQILKFSEELKETRRGKGNPMFGRKHSEETIRKIKETWKKKRAKVA